MEAEILQEEQVQLCNGRTAPLRIVRLPNGQFKTSLGMVEITFSSQFHKEEQAIAFYEYLKKRLAE